MDKVDKEKIVGIAKRHNLTLMVLFGSQATGHTHKKSDVDVGYLADREINYQGNYDISLELAQIFKNPDVELVSLNNISPELKKQVADTGIVLYEDNVSIFDQFKISAFKLYVESKPLREFRATSIKKFIFAHV